MMAAYNALNSIPCSANSWLLNDVLRKEWGFKGVVVSDWSGVPHLYNNHHCVESRQEGAVEAIKAGLDIDLPREYNYKMLIEAVREGKLSEDVLEVNVRRVLWLKFYLGLFENPFVEDKEAEIFQDHPAHRALALEAARKSMILLKNDGVLPIQKSIKRIAVLGPNANAVRLGGYSATGVKAITPFDGLKRIFGNEVELMYEEGTGLFSGSPTKMVQAVNVAKDADLSILFMGGGPGSGGESGLSYTTFEYSDLVIKDENTLTPCVSIDVKNTGRVGGDEIVQLYLSSKANRMVRRVKELKRFQRIHLESGESKRVEFKLKGSDFEFLNEKLELEIDKGEYEVLVGQNSANGLKAKLVVE